MKIEQISIKEIKEHERNPRIHSKEQINQICRSIKEFGFNVPILIDENNIILAGHGRFFSAKKLELEKVPTIKIPHLSPEQKKAYIIADNKIALNSKWNSELLFSELEELKLKEYDIDITGFNQIELLTLDEENTDNIVNDIDEEWVNMPEYEQEDEKPYRTLYVHFRKEEDVRDFFQILHQSFTNKTKSIWHPKLIQKDNKSIKYE